MGDLDLSGTRRRLKAVTGRRRRRKRIPVHIGQINREQGAYAVENVLSFTGRMWHPERRTG